MDISTSDNTITIVGNIKSVSDFQDIKTAIDAVVRHHDSIKLKVVDSLSITSSVIGYLNKLILKDKINMVLEVGDKQLMDLLEDLNLTELFKARKV